MVSLLKLVLLRALADGERKAPNVVSCVMQIQANEFYNVIHLKGNKNYMGN